jgi:spore maturation protein CgeB
MKALLVGYHNPNFVNSFVYRERAVRYLGHDLISFDDRGFLLPGRIRSKFKFLQQWDLQRLNAQLIRLVKQKSPDACFIVGGQRILPTTVSQIKKMGVPVALWTTDAPIDFSNILGAAPFYDQLFCAGSEAGDIFYAHGFKNVTWVPFGCDPNYHKPVSLSQAEQKQYGHDLVFIGSYYPNRGKLLESVADFDIGVWGPYWQQLPENSPLKKKAVNIKMNYDQWVRIYNASKINIVVHYQNDKVPCHQASPKLFEAMACGSFVLCDRQKDAVNLFKDRQDLVFFDDANDLREKVNYYLKHEQERRRIAQRGYQEAIAKHTYQDRFKRMLEILNKG